MPRTGTPIWNTAWGARGVSLSVTLAGPPDRMIAWGLDASRAFPNAIPLHTHDAAMQLWLELGLPGAALTAAFFVWLIGRIDRLEANDRPAAAAAAASLSAYLVVGALSFGAWQEWWLALGALAAAATTALTRAARS